MYSQREQIPTSSLNDSMFLIQFKEKLFTQEELFNSACMIIMEILKPQKDDYTQKIKKLLTKCKRGFPQLKEFIKTFEIKLHEINNVKDQYETNIRNSLDLESQLSSLKKEVQSLTESKSVIESDYNAMSSDYIKLLNNKKALSICKVDMFEFEKKENEDNKKLQNEILKIKNVNEELMEKNEKYGKDVQTLKKKLENYKKEVIVLNNEIERLQKERELLLLKQNTVKRDIKEHGRLNFEDDNSKVLHHNESMFKKITPRSGSQNKRNTSSNKHKRGDRNSQSNQNYNSNNIQNIKEEPIKVVRQVNQDTNVDNNNNEKKSDQSVSTLEVEKSFNTKYTNTLFLFEMN